MTPAAGLVAETAVKRLAGERPSRPRALATAAAAGFAAGAAVYRLLRSGGSEDRDQG